MMNNLIILIVFLLLVASWNGFVIVWGLNKNAEIRRKANKIWHRIGWFIRAIPVAVMVYYYWGYFPDVLQIISLSALFGHGFYNIIINIIRGMDWDYTGSQQGGTVSWWDMLFKTKWSFRIVFIIEILFVTYAFL